MSEAPVSAAHTLEAGGGLVVLGVKVFLAHARVEQSGGLGGHSGFSGLLVPNCLWQIERSHTLLWNLQSQDWNWHDKDTKFLFI